MTPLPAWRARRARPASGAMQFLESAATALNKVDALAAEVIPPRRPGALDDEAGEDLLETNPGSVNTASTVEALASRLGLWLPGDGREGIFAREALALEDARVRDVPGDDPLVTSQRMKLAHLVNNLRELESNAVKARTARDDALAAASDANATGEREASEALETLERLRGEIETERAALEEIERRSNGSETETATSTSFAAALAETRALVARRLSDARAKEREAVRLEAEADALETRAKERARAAGTLTSTETQDAAAAADRERAETERLLKEVMIAEAEAADLQLEESARLWRASQASSAFREADSGDTRFELERRLEDLMERLESKRAETAALTLEKLALEHVVAVALAERRGVAGERASGTETFARASHGGPSSAGLKRRGDDATGEGSFTGLGVRARVASAARRVDTLGVAAGRHLRGSGGLRSAALLYALGLHLFAFLVLACRALSGAPELKPTERVDGNGIAAELPRT